MSLADDLERIHRLHQQGAIDDREYADAKAKLLNPATANSNQSTFDSQSSFDSNTAWAQINKLRRSSSDKWLGGVCGGLARFTQVEAWVWRLVFFMAFIFGGTGFIAYLLAWIFIPEDTTPNAYLP